MSHSSNLSDEMAGTLAIDAGLPRILLFSSDAKRSAQVQEWLGKTYSVIGVRDKESALEAARHPAPDLIIAQTSQHTDAFELIRTLRNDPLTGSIPRILILTRAGAALPPDIEESAEDCLLEPFSARALLARVAKSFELAGLRHIIKTTARQ